MIKVRGSGYGVREITYERYSELMKQWVPLAKEELTKLFNNQVVIWMNPRS